MPLPSKKLVPPKFRTISDVAGAVSVTNAQLCYYAYILKSAKKYRNFEISKKNGEKRLISTPIPPLKSIQEQLLKHLKPAYGAKAHVHGYVNGRGPISNADIHKFRRWVLHVDIQDFFPSITIKRVQGLFRAFPFNYNAKIANLLARLCCAWEMLPQGAPTSPLISNLICRSLDTRMATLAKEHRCVYTRYCDDLTFSTGRQSFPAALASLDAPGQQPTVGDELAAIVSEQGFELRESKTTLRHRTEHQMVTGLTVNQFTNVPRKYIRSLRNLLFIWRTHGKPAAEKSFYKLWQPNRPKGKATPTLEEIIRGRVQYVGSVKGWFDRVYRQLAADLQQVDATYKPTIKHSNRPKTVIIVHCEGKTDVKHIKAAWNKYKGGFPQLDLRFNHATNDAELLKRVQSLSSINQNTPLVGLFDSDNKQIVNDVKGGADGFRRWSRGVYSFVLPTPAHRDEGDPLCIELLHTDATLALKDSSGRRIYCLSEFKANSFHTDGHAVMTKGKSSLIVSEVRDVNTQENIALSKDSFAEMVLVKKAPFDGVDLNGFKPIFERLVKMRQQWLEDKLQPF